MVPPDSFLFPLISPVCVPLRGSYGAANHSVLTLDGRNEVSGERALCATAGWMSNTGGRGIAPASDKIPVSSATSSEPSGSMMHDSRGLQGGEPVAIAQWSPAAQRPGAGVSDWWGKSN